MNFLAHFVIANRFLTPQGPLPAYVAGTALPDLLPLAAERVRLRPAQIAQSAPQNELESAVSAGISVHLATDAAFHKSAAFAQAQVEVSLILAEARFEGIRVRRFFAAHVLTELALDAVLLRDELSMADQFYGAFAQADFANVTHWAAAVTGKALPNFPSVLSRFARSGYLRCYVENDGVATGFSNICRRAGQDTFEDKNFSRLVDVTRQVTSVLPAYVPALLSETTREVLLTKQEGSDAAANALPIAQGDT